MVLNPADDDAFAAFAERSLDEGDDIEAFQEQLRLVYPLAVVHERVLSGERATVWYVYRDGRWTRSSPRGR